ncbi:OsmC family protein [Phenylobacterium sp.]|uniref:OsmC family protein n=1 Tax=Phenylobacterium sp. TaxID=1871053 RepID=UPI0035AF53A5
MAEIEVELRNIAGTEAALGWAGAHTIVVDRPEGRAGGKGLGFNGGQLLALALGGCFCNDLRYAAAELGAPLADISVSVRLTLDGAPLVATSAELKVSCTGAGEAEIEKVIAHAARNCTVANSLRAGFPVDIRRDG